MEIRHDTAVRHPRELVFRTYRDRLPELVPHIPNIAAVQVQERTEAGTVVHLVNFWRAQGEIPKVAQGVIRPELLTWIDRAAWDEAEWTCAWTFETQFLPGRIHAAGLNRFVPDGRDSTRVEIRGELRLPESGIPGVPAFAGRVIVPQIERFVVALVTPNLVRVTDGLERFLDAERRERGEPAG